MKKSLSYKSLLRGIMLTSCVFTLSSCSEISSLWSGTNPTSLAKYSSVNNGNNSSHIRWNKPDHSDGVKEYGITDHSSPLFDKKNNNPIERIERIEAIVERMNDELGILIPTMLKIDDLEEDVEIMNKQISMLLHGNNGSHMGAFSSDGKLPMPADHMSHMTNDGVLSPPARLAPDKYAMAEDTEINKVVNVILAPEKTNADSSPTSAASVKNLRVGEHKNKTRLVFDTSHKAKFNHDLDNSEKLFIVEFPNTAWAGKSQVKFTKSPMVSSYSVQPMNGAAGSRVIIKLKQEANIIYKNVIEASNGGDHRIVFDLAK
jgi:hypothetical protein